MALYFLGAEGMAVTKIGFAALQNVKARVSSCQTGSPVRLHLKAVYPFGDRLTDAGLRWQFLAHRLHGDWFNDCEALDDIIAKARAGDRINGLWHIPGHHPIGRNDENIGIRTQTMLSRFGLTVTQCYAIAGTAAPQFNGHVLTGSIPRLLESFQTHGFDMTYLDLLEHPTGMPSDASSYQCTCGLRLTTSASALI